jgi:hypothetical protein
MLPSLEPRYRQAAQRTVPGCGSAETTERRHSLGQQDTENWLSNFASQTAIPPTDLLLFTGTAMLSPLLAALLFFAPGPQNFDGLKLHVPEAPRDPVVKGAVKTWEGNYTTTSQEKAVILTYSVAVTDLKALPQKPTEDQVLALHERSARANKKLAAQSLRRIEGKIGEHKLLLLSGTALAPTRTGTAAGSYWLSFAFTTGDKVYEYFQVSFYETNHTPTLGYAAEMTLTEDSKESKVTGLSKESNGDYTIAGLPFIVSTPVLLAPSTVSPHEPAFGGQYTALHVNIFDPTVWYKVREVKPEETRTDSQLFRDLVRPPLPAGAIPEDQFAVKDGSGTLETAYKSGDKDYVAYLRFEREGKWVAVLVSYAPKGREKGLKDTAVRRIKAGP